ncbi:MAG: hypothetical protein ACRDEA_00200 [Microcystaceae cyanobacterium]
MPATFLSKKVQCNANHRIVIEWKALLANYALSDQDVGLIWSEMYRAMQLSSRVIRMGSTTTGAGKLTDQGIDVYSTAAEQALITPGTTNDFGTVTAAHYSS